MFLFLIFKHRWSMVERLGSDDDLVPRDAVTAKEYASPPEY